MAPDLSPGVGPGPLFAARVLQGGSGQGLQVGALHQNAAGETQGRTVEGRVGLGGRGWIGIRNDDNTENSQHPSNAYITPHFSVVVFPGAGKSSVHTHCACSG